MNNYLVLPFVLLSFSCFGNEVESNEEGQRSATLCEVPINFNAKPTIKEQSLKLSKNISLKLQQGISSIRVNGKEIATNVICQNLVGSNYTGSDEEWANYIKNALEGIKRTGAKGIRLSLSAGQDMLFSKNKNAKEYKIFANINNHDQIFMNYAYLGNNNTLYSFSVSGSAKKQKVIEAEFVKVVKAFLNLKSV